MFDDQIRQIGKFYFYRPLAPYLGKTVIGFVGEMGVQDGVDYLLRALQHLVVEQQRTDWVCVLVGTGDALLFTGFVEYAEVVRYLSGMHICVSPDPSNPYNDRSTMVKIMEYMALSKPIVVFDLPEHRYSAQAAAVYVQPNDERAFARALVRLMDDPGLRDRMGAAGRQRVERALTWSHSVPHLLHAYQTLFPEMAQLSPARPPSGGSQQVFENRLSNA